MKRVSAALAVVTAVLLMGSASAKAPDTSATSRLRQLGIMRPEGLPGLGGSVAEPGISEVVDSAEEADADAVNAVADAIEDGTPLTEELLSGLPPEVADILSALPFMPEPAQEVLPAPAPSLVPEVLPGPAPSEEPKPEEAPPAPAPIVRALRKLRTAAGDLATVFPGLPATGHAGTTTGSVIHADTLTGPGGGTQLEKVDEAFSASTFTSSPIAQALTNEFARITSQALGANSGYGRGSGLEVGLAQTSDAEPQLSLQRAEAKSPPSTPLITHEVGPTNVDPIAAASALLGQAQSLAQAACTTGIDLSFGRGYAADAGLVSSGDGHLIKSTSPTPPNPAVSESRSATRLIPQANPDPSPTGIAKFGLQSETRQIIAPVTLFQGTPAEVTLKFGGEWVLRAVADGKGVGDVFYGPGTVEPQVPLLTILQGTNIVQQINADQIFGPEGLSIPLPGGVGEIALGEDPRAIGGDTSTKPTETNTYAAGAVDVARVLLGPDGEFGDIRIGHMEAAVAVPAGGIECGIGLLKKSSRDRVSPGDTFDWTITVTNPNDCVLTKLKVVDTITADNGVKWAVVGSNPKADSQSNTSVTWNDVGPLNPGQSKDLVITVTVDRASGAGKFLDTAVATGVCGPAAGTAGAEAGVGVPLEARVQLNLPEVTVVLDLVRGELPRTGGLLTVLPALAMLGAGALLRRLKGRR